jgi:putative transposase
MPWKEPMSEKVRLVSECLKGERPISEICREIGVSRPTAYKWFGRFKADQAHGLQNRSRARKTMVHETPADVVEQLTDLKSRFPHWGPKKIVAYLEKASPDIHWPAPSTVGEVFKRRGLVQKRRFRRSAKPTMEGVREGERPNDMWAVDYKGWFRTQDGLRVDPLTISDLASRYLLRCEAVTKTGFESVRRAFEAVFREFGMPIAIRSDNGAPFATTGLGGLSRLGVWWIKLGIRHDRIRPGHPEENGKHERMHLTLKQTAATPPRATLTEQEIAFQNFIEEFNQQRPHEALGMRTPADCYEPSPRVYPPRMEDFEYGSRHKVKTVRSGGTVKWGQQDLYVSMALIGEDVGFVEVMDGEWRVDFRTHPLGFYSDRSKVMSPISSE